MRRVLLSPSIANQSVIDSGTVCIKSKDRKLSPSHRGLGNTIGVLELQLVVDIHQLAVPSSTEGQPTTTPEATSTTEGFPFNEAEHGQGSQRYVTWINLLQPVAFFHPPKKTKQKNEFYETFLIKIHDIYRCYQILSSMLLFYGDTYAPLTVTSASSKRRTDGARVLYRH